MPHRQMSDPERLARIETLLETYEKTLLQNGDKADSILQTLLDKLDLLDVKMEARFSNVEHSASEDAKELQALKNKGAGVLAAIGVIFTATATVFSEFFVYVKHAIFG